MNSLENKILSKLDMTSSDCWIWVGRVNNNGRPIISLDEVIDGDRKVNVVVVHKWVYSKRHPELFDVRYVDNICGNRRCVNPDHHQARTFNARFWGNISKAESGCWEWMGKLQHTGYGVVTIDGISKLVHRVAYETHYEEQIPDGLMVCHKCNNRKCINPEHLYVGTHNDNMRDMANSDVMKGEHNPKALLTKDQVVEIKSLIRSRMITYRNIAAKYGVSRQAIKDIASGRTWSWV